MKCLVDGCNKEAKAKNYCSGHYTRFRLYGSTEPKSFDHVPIEIKFWQVVDKRSDDECWNWLRPPSSNGYGRIRVNETGKEESAHRVSWWLNNQRQAIPKNMVVMHSCDNKLCVNPKHLSLGTPKDNMEDKIRKGRAKYVGFVGSKNRNSLLDDDKVMFIKTSKLSHVELGRMFSVSPSCIADVRKERSWTHIKVDI